MKKFLVRIVVFVIFISMAGEIIIRIFKLTPEIPKLYWDNTGIRRYTPGQTGYYTKAKSKWVVNKYGWLGLANTKQDTTISIVGDSYIENIMNPISCNQGSILQSHFKNYGFFEAGRSGVTFIEAMQITKMLDTTIHPTLHLVYIADDDFYESYADKQRYKDRVQIDLATNTILNGDFKSPGSARLLYSCKLLYYLYLRYPIFVKSNNKENHLEKNQTAKAFDRTNFDKILTYCRKNYRIQKIVLVFHPGTDKRIIDLTKQYGFKTISLNSDNDKKSWAMNENDGHWSCYGHAQVANQVSSGLKAALNDNKN